MFFTKDCRHCIANSWSHCATPGDKAYYRHWNWARVVQASGDSYSVKKTLRSKLPSQAQLQSRNELATGLRVFHQ